MYSKSWYGLRVGGTVKQQEIVVQGKVQSELSHEHTQSTQIQGISIVLFLNTRGVRLHMLKPSVNLLLSTLSVPLSACPCRLRDWERQHTCF